MPRDTQATRLLDYVRSHGMIRPRDLEVIGVPRTVLKRLTDRGELMRRSRGIYTLPDHPLTRHTDMAELCARYPDAIVCLISALDFHELTTQIARSIWVMVDRKARRPRVKEFPLEVAYASGDSLTAGVEAHQIEGIKVQITNPAKTVADCFKYRDRVGLDIAIEALRDCLRQRKASPAEIYDMAEIDRVANLVRLYLEALL